MSEVVLSARNLGKSFTEGGKKLTVLQRLDLTLKKGDMLAVVGASGCGKSTLLNLLAGLDEPNEGHVEMAGQRLSTLNETQLCQLRNRKLGFVFQFHHLLPEFTALENVAMPLLIAKASPGVARQKATALLEQVGLGDRLQHKPGELSGGERQRVAIARSLVTDPAIVMADEPTGNLDEQTAGQVQDLLMQLNQSSGTAFLVVTHDARFAAKCHRILRLHDGQLHEGEPG